MLAAQLVAQDGGVFGAGEERSFCAGFVDLNGAPGIHLNCGVGSGRLSACFELRLFEVCVPRLDAITFASHVPRSVQVSEIKVTHR